MEPFTTQTAIVAHNYAFKYLGGRTQTIMYDQDRVFVVSENLGNIIFVKEFEDYVKARCHSHTGSKWVFPIIYIFFTITPPHVFSYSKP